MSATMTTGGRGAAMWMRHENKPVRKWGIEFKSSLEVNVAEQLDTLGIEWAYERAVPDSIKYLPDFTIVGQPNPDYRCPQWIEVKPAELLYAARNYFKIDERFENDVFAPATVDDFLTINPDTELAKPKYLAERYGESVLVVSHINATRRLSIEMRPDGAVFSRSHPLVNWVKVVKDREAAERRAHWDAVYAERRAEQEAERRRMADARAETGRRNLAVFKTFEHRPARYATRCCVCGTTGPAEQMRIAYVNDEIRWVGCCAIHLA